MFGTDYVPARSSDPQERDGGEKKILRGRSPIRPFRASDDPLSKGPKVWKKFSGEELSDDDRVTVKGKKVHLSQSRKISSQKVGEEEGARSSFGRVTKAWCDAESGKTRNMA